MPFITEELWHLLNKYSEDKSISLEQLISSSEKLINEKVIEDFEKIISLSETSRSLKSNLNGISPTQKIPISITTSLENADLFNANVSVITSVTGSLNVEINKPLNEDVVRVTSSTNFAEVNLYVGDAIDVDQEIERLEKEINRLEGQVNGISKKLSNERFVNNAPEDVVNRERKKLKDMTNKIEQLNESLNSFK
jgi:valyl-tRNA synthetase